MKKFAAIFLLFVFLFNMIGVYTVFKVQRYYVRKEVKNYLIDHVDEARLVPITIPRAEVNTGSVIQWEEEHEFRYKGRMYDIVRTVETDSTITYYSFHDTKDDVLFANLEEETDEKMKGRKAQLQKAGAQTTYYLAAQAYNVFLAENKVVFSYCPQQYTVPYIGLVSPPPEA